jgi:hypothetical protein
MILGLVHSRGGNITRAKSLSAATRLATASKTAILMPSEIVLLCAEEFAVADLRGKTDVFIAPGLQVRVDAIRLTRAMVAASLAASAQAGLIKLEVSAAHGLRLKPGKTLEHDWPTDWPTQALEAIWPHLVNLAKPRRGPAGIEACLNCLLLERHSPPEILEQTVNGLLQRGLIRENAWPRTGYGLTAQTKTLLDVYRVKHLMLEPARVHTGFWALFEGTFDTVFAHHRWRG